MNPRNSHDSAPGRPAVARAMLHTLALAIILPPLGICEFTIGGWDESRGGDAALLSGIQFELARADLASFFPETTLAETSSLTPEFLDSIDALMISVVYSVWDQEIQPLSAAEQDALLDFVSHGGRALLITDNRSYCDASRSFVGPFGLNDACEFLASPRDGTIVDHVSFPMITDGPFGTVSTFQGAYISWYGNTAGAETLGVWDINSQAALAATKVGAGRVVFLGDFSLVGEDRDPGNIALRRNVLAYLHCPAADLSGDCCVGQADLGILLADWGHGAGGDLDGDGDTDQADLGILLGHWGDGCP